MVLGTSCNRGMSDMDFVSPFGLRPSPVVKVVVRFRPLLKEETNSGDIPCVSCRGGKVKLKPPKHLAAAGGVREFEFDRAIAPTCGQGEVFDVTTARLIDRAIQGRDGVVILAGTPRSGRTHTLWGSSSAPGILRSAMSALLRGCDEEVVLRLCVAEVWGDDARDLLVDSVEGSSTGVGGGSSGGEDPGSGSKSPSKWISPSRAFMAMLPSPTRTRKQVRVLRASRVLAVGEASALSLDDALDMIRQGIQNQRFGHLVIGAKMLQQDRNKGAPKGQMEEVTGELLFVEIGNEKPGDLVGSLERVMASLKMGAPGAAQPPLSPHHHPSSKRLLELIETAAAHQMPSHSISSSNGSMKAQGLRGRGGSHLQIDGLAASLLVTLRAGTEGYVEKSTVLKALASASRSTRNNGAKERSLLANGRSMSFNRMLSIRRSGKKQKEESTPSKLAVTPAHPSAPPMSPPVSSNSSSPGSKESLHATWPTNSSLKASIEEDSLLRHSCGEIERGVVEGEISSSPSKESLTAVAGGQSKTMEAGEVKRVTTNSGGNIPNALALEWVPENKAKKGRSPGVWESLVTASMNLSFPPQTEEQRLPITSPHAEEEEQQWEQGKEMRDVPGLGRGNQGQKKRLGGPSTVHTAVMRRGGGVQRLQPPPPPPKAPIPVELCLLSREELVARVQEAEKSSAYWKDRCADTEKKLAAARVALEFAAPRTRVANSEGALSPKSSPVKERSSTVDEEKNIRDVEKDIPHKSRAPGYVKLTRPVLSHHTDPIAEFCTDYEVTVPSSASNSPGGDVDSVSGSEDKQSSSPAVSPPELRHPRRAELVAAVEGSQVGAEARAVEEEVFHDLRHHVHQGKTKEQQLPSGAGFGGVRGNVADKARPKSLSMPAARTRLAVRGDNVGMSSLSPCSEMEDTVSVSTAAEKVAAVASVGSGVTGVEGCSSEGGRGTRANSGCLGGTSTGNSEHLTLSKVGRRRLNERKQVVSQGGISKQAARLTTLNKMVGQSQTVDGVQATGQVSRLSWQGTRIGRKSREGVRAEDGGANVKPEGFSLTLPAH